MIPVETWITQLRDWAESSVRWKHIHAHTVISKFLEDPDTTLDDRRQFAGAVRELVQRGRL